MVILDCNQCPAHWELNGLITNQQILRSISQAGRITTSDLVGMQGNVELGVLSQLPGRWSNSEGLEGRGWNMIALPFGPQGGLGDFRLLLNQANEKLDFDLVDLRVPNRGVNREDQHVAALRYFQSIDQISAVDAASSADGTVAEDVTPDTNDTPKGSTLPGSPSIPAGIHREPGLFINITTHSDPDDPARRGPDIVRLATIPHGDAVFAMGSSASQATTSGAPNFDDAALQAEFSPFPIGIGDIDPASAYLGPYFHFQQNKFKGIFDPTQPLGLLKGAIELAIPGSTVIETTTFSVDTTLEFKGTLVGSVTNIPFVIKQANATRVHATFWIQNVHTPMGQRFIIQYAQRVLLEFFPRFDGQPGRIAWPHISINTMIRSDQNITNPVVL